MSKTTIDIYNFLNKWTLDFKDSKLQKEYYKTEYKFLNFVIIFSILAVWTVLNLFFNIFADQLSLTHTKNIFYLEISIIVCSILVLILILSQKIWQNTSKYLKTYRVISCYAVFNLLFQPAITFALVNPKNTSMFYILLYVHFTLLILWIDYIEKSYIINTTAIIVFYILTVALSITNEFMYASSIAIYISLAVFSVIFNYLNEKRYKLKFIEAQNNIEFYNFTQNLLEDFEISGFSLNSKLETHYFNKNLEMLGIISSTDSTNKKLLDLIFRNYSKINEKLDSVILNIIKNTNQIDDCLLEQQIELIFKTTIIPANFTLIGSKIITVHFQTRTVMVYFRKNSLNQNLEFLVLDTGKLINESLNDVQNKFKDMFLNKFSHEFKNPLINVLQLVNNLESQSNNMINLHMTENNREFNQEDNQNLGHIRNLCNFMLNLILDLEFMSKKSNLKLPKFTNLNYKKDSKNVILRKIITNCVNIYNTRISLNDKSIKIIERIDTDIPHLINIDGQRLQQIFMNILSNSYKFTNYGEIVIEIKRNTSDSNIMEIKVTDSGIGMSRSLINKIGEPFNFESNSNNNIYGLGFGFYIIKQLVNEIGFNFSINSEIDCFTCISFSILLDEVENYNFSLESKARTTTNEKSVKNVIKKRNNTLTAIKLNKSIGEIPIDKKRTSQFFKAPPAIITEEDVSLLESNNTPQQIIESISNINSTVLIENMQILINSPSRYNLDPGHIYKYTKTKSSITSKSGRRRTRSDNNSKELEIVVENGKIIRILVVEDDRLIRQSHVKAIKRYFKSENHDVEIIECKDGIECLNQIYNGLQHGIRYDLVLTDETMNFMRGSLMARTIKTLQAEIGLYSFRVVMVTSYSSDSFIKSLEDCIDDVFSKPLSEDIVRNVCSPFIN